MYVGIKKTLTKEEREKKQKEIRKQFERDQELVKGVFHFHEVPGGTLTFPYKKYRWEDIETYTLVDGQTYTIKRGVAEHLNNGTSYPVHKNILDAAGRPIQSIGERKKRTSFQSMDYIDSIKEDQKQDGKLTVSIPDAPSALVNVMK